jgi:hypothetical protein
LRLLRPFSVQFEVQRWAQGLRNNEKCAAKATVPWAVDADAAAAVAAAAF